MSAGGLFYNLFKNHPTALKEFKENSKGFFQDINKVGQYDTALKNKAISDPGAYYADYDQWLKGTRLSGPNNDPSLHMQYEGDPSYYRPAYLGTSGEWYDYKNNKWKKYGEGGFGGGTREDGTSTGDSFTPTEPTDADTPLPDRPSKGYNYKTDNPYVDLQQMLKDTAPISQTGMGVGMGQEYLDKLGMGQEYLNKLLGR